MNIMFFWDQIWKMKVIERSIEKESQKSIISVITADLLSKKYVELKQIRFSS